MTDICERQPWGWRRFQRRHLGETGLVVYGWFNRQRGWVSFEEWAAVVVIVDGTQRAILVQRNRGLVFIDLDLGAHDVRFVGAGKELHSERLELAEHHAELIMFRPPRRAKIWGPSRTRPTWCRRPAW